MSTGRGRGGRGEYYTNKYGGGGGGRGRRGAGAGAGAGRGQTEQQPDHKRGEAAGGTSVDLYRLLESINGSQYGAYHGIETRNGWRFSSFSLFIERAQSDPFAAPTRVRLLIPHTRAGLPSSLYSNKIRSIGLSDYLHRSLHDHCKEIGMGVGFAGTGSWSGPKGGDLAIFPPCQHVLEQTAVRIRPSGDVVIQMTLNLPARGRTILGQAAVQAIETLASLVENTMQYWNASLKSDQIETYVDSIEDQVWLQSQLDSQGLAAFVRNGAILPRLSGADDKPMDSETAIPFQSPPTLHTSFKLPNSGITIHGMGLRKGVSIIVGGGFHGKSTLLEALQVGVYPKVPGDGREFVVTSPTAMKIRAEDGRPITAVDISPFIGNLPFGRDTSCFSTPDASGSTSQAANIVEAIEARTNLLLVDEDTSATNFMIRDDKMMKLVAPHKEPITPFVRKVRALYQERGISSIIVVGASGDFFDVADIAIMMDGYRCEDVTEQAKRIAEEFPSSCTGQQFGAIRPRFPVGRLFELRGKTKVMSTSTFKYGDDEVDLSGLEQIVCIAQTNAIILAIQKFASFVGTHTLPESIVQLDAFLDHEGMDGLSPGHYHGGLARPRQLEIAGAINRFRIEGCISQADPSTESR